MIGLLCPGQGSQFVGMGRDLADAFPLAARTFAEADDALGFPLSSLCWEGPEDELTATVNAQPAILAHTVAVWRVLQQERPLDVAMAAGHSLGEFSAYVAAGALDFADAVRTVRTRGDLMYQAGQVRSGAMAAVIGLDDAIAEQICRDVSTGDSVVVPANFNSPGQLVVSGDSDAVVRVEPRLREAGAKRVIPLNVSGAFHSPLMRAAEAGLRAALDDVEVREPNFAVVSNVTAVPVSESTRARELLLRQLTAPVRWTDSVRAMVAAGVRDFFEIGPGNVLTGLLRRIDRSATGRAIGTAADLRTHIAEEV